jgi:serine/threonine protein kinase
MADVAVVRNLRIGPVRARLRILGAHLNDAKDTKGEAERVDPLLARASGRVGSILHGKWRLDRVLGVGGMAAVYSATHRNGTRAAVKILHPELAVFAPVGERFFREGYLANTVGHEGVVKISDDDRAEDGSAYLVMELLDGETIEDRRLRKGGLLQEDDVLAIAHQLLDVLAAAHAKGIVHRDVKPENLLLTRPGGKVKVLDFGIARLREQTSGRAVTTSGSLMGTPDYMAPEQARGLWEEVDDRSDLWAVGATMFHLLSGKLVHTGRTASEILVSAMTQRAPSLASVAPNVSAAVVDLVDRALQFDPKERWQDAASMQQAVCAAYDARFGASIAAAPELTVPDTVPSRSAPGTALPWPEPERPAPSIPRGSPPPSRPRRSPLAFVGFLAIGFLMLAVPYALGALSRRPNMPETASPHAGEASPALAASPVPTVQMPEMAATDLPRVPSPPAHAAATRVATTKPTCVVPYTYDPLTRHTHFKPECL